MAKMTDDEVLAICKAQINGALGFLNGKLAQARLKALQYYNAEPYGNEVEGSSQIVTTKVRDVVESIMPSLMKIFVSGDKVAEFDPVGPGDEAVAGQATDYTNYIFTKDNKGYDVLQTALRDGLIQKCGVVKIGWEDSEDIAKDSYQGLTDLELEQLVVPDDVEVVAHDAYAGALMQPNPQTGLPSPQPATLHDVVVRKRKKTGRVKIRAVPPEEFLISRRAVSLAGAAFIGHRVRKTATELLEMGYARKVVDGLPGNDAQDFNAERLERFSAEDEAPFVTNPALDPSTKEVWLTECYLKMDYDGDGLAELRKVTVAGDPGMTILDNEEIDSLPFAYWTPVPQPHKFFGLSMADLTMDLQLTQSTVTRHVLDNMYRANNGRFAISGNINNVHGGKGNGSIAKVRAGNITASAKTAAARMLVGQRLLLPAIPVANDTAILKFGGVDAPLILEKQVNTFSLQQVPKVVIPPQGSCLIHIWLPSQSGAASFIPKLGWVERAGE